MPWAEFTRPDDDRAGAMAKRFHSREVRTDCPFASPERHGLSHVRGRHANVWGAICGPRCLGARSSKPQRRVTLALVADGCPVGLLGEAPYLPNAKQERLELINAA